MKILKKEKRTIFPNKLLFPITKNETGIFKLMIKVVKKYLHALFVPV